MRDFKPWYKNTRKLRADGQRVKLQILKLNVVSFLPSVLVVFVFVFFYKLYFSQSKTVISVTLL